MTDRQIAYRRIIARSLEYLTRDQIAEVIRAVNDSYCSPYELQLALNGLMPLPTLEEATQ